MAVANSAGKVEVIDRRRVAITTPGTPGANQPYHFAESSKFQRRRSSLETVLRLQNASPWRLSGMS